MIAIPGTSSKRKLVLVQVSHKVGSTLPAPNIVTNSEISKKAFLKLIGGLHFFLPELDQEYLIVALYMGSTFKILHQK